MALFGSETNNINLNDPAEILRNQFSSLPSWSSDFLTLTQKFYEDAQQLLVYEIPMKTYLKHRYSSGINTDLLEDQEFPETRDIWTLNASRFFRIGLKKTL